MHAVIINGSPRTEKYSNTGKIMDAFSKGMEEARNFSGPEYFSLPIRILLQFLFTTVGKKRFAKAAKEWGCKVPIDYQPWA